MIKLAENFFEIVRPFIVIFAPIVLLGLLSCLLKILHPDYYRPGFFSHTVRVKMRRRRKAYWRLLKYKISKRFSRRESVDFKRDSYLWNYTYRDKR